jgi:hypothetical protein
MFCPKCGADNQIPESYCKRCGEWLPDLDAVLRPGLFRKRTREEKIRKMRILEVVSAGLALTAAAIVGSVLAGGTDPQLLFLAVLCCLIVAVYQIVNFYLGHKLHQSIDQSRTNSTEGIKGVHGQPQLLSPADTTPFVNRSSVVENTTELLEPIPRVKKHDAK